MVNIQENIVITYDGSFEGLLTVVFEVFDRKVIPIQITNRNLYVNKMFETVLNIETDEIRAERVLKGLVKKVSSNGLRDILKVFHSEQPDIELVVLSFIRLVFNTKINIEKDYRQDPVLQIKQVVKMIDREVHRMHAFVRFQKTSDGIYAATIKPDFDVIPFIGSHFKKRYADQHWLIYDVKRDYGLFYDQNKMETVKLPSHNWVGSKKKLDNRLLEDGEQEYEHMWKGYFDNTCIQERRNMRLHLQHVPKRYWSYLPEKFLVN